MTPRLKEQYNNKIVNDLVKEFSLKNKLMVPKITKVVLNQTDQRSPLGINVT